MFYVSGVVSSSFYPSFLEVTGVGPPLAKQAEQQVAGLLQHNLQHACDPAKPGNSLDVQHCAKL